MPRIIETTVYQFSELSEAAKEKARAWYLLGDQFDFSADYTIQEADTVARIFGLEIDTRQVHLMNVKLRGEPCVYYSGFCSQGDGACFEGRYMYTKGAAKKIREYAPVDAELHRIVDALQQLQKENFYQLRAKCTHAGRYYHARMMSVDVYRLDEKRIDENTEEALTELLRDFADWIYSQLNKEYDYVQSDDYVDENITANEYEFTEEGEPA
jgi:hypothetical protein